MSIYIGIIFGHGIAHGDRRAAQDLKPGKLPEPQLTIGKPLMEVLKARKSSRDFKHEKLPVQTLSNLLWAAWGINRPEAGKHTAPSSRNKQEIDVYVATADGLFLYDAKNHSLELILSARYTGEMRHTGLCEECSRESRVSSRIIPA